MRRILWASLALVPLSACNAAPAETDPVVAQAAAPTLPLTVQSGDKTHSFRVEVARSPDAQAQGLMFRERLAPDGGMLFPFDPPRIASFWMKNTLIPLDMIFVRTDGTIERIAANTVPHSLQPVASSEPVAAVLEIAGGRAAQLGLKPGDRVEWPR